MLPNSAHSKRTHTNQKYEQYYCNWLTQFPVPQNNKNRPSAIAHDSTARDNDAIRMHDQSTNYIIVLRVSVNDKNDSLKLI